MGASRRHNRKRVEEKFKVEPHGLSYGFIGLHYSQESEVSCLFLELFDFKFLLHVNPKDAVFIKTAQVVSAA